MDWLTFTATMFGHLAWPITLLIALSIFRKPLLRRLPFLKKATWGDKSLEFSDELNEALEQAEGQLALTAPPAALPAPEVDIQAQNFENERFSSILDVSPRLAVIEAWIPVEQELQKAARAKGYAADRTRSTTYTIRQLQNDGTISSGTAKTIKQLLYLRNLAAHEEGDVSNQDALSYRSLAKDTLDRVKALGHE